MGCHRTSCARHSKKADGRTDMGTRSKRDTLVIVRDVARSMGATVLEERNSMKHPGVRIRTREGAEFWMRVSQGKIEPYKQRGWVRQAIRRADRKKANDNNRSLHGTR